MNIADTVLAVFRKRKIKKFKLGIKKKRPKRNLQKKNCGKKLKTSSKSLGKKLLNF